MNWIEQWDKWVQTVRARKASRERIEKMFEDLDQEPEEGQEAEAEGEAE